MKKELFWTLVDVRGPDDCWPWKVGKTGSGYGAFYPANQKKQVRAHRYAWEITHGQIPPKMAILHHCDNPICCNPKHLFLGTQKDNLLDMDKKGRRKVNLSFSQRDQRGEKNFMAKLTTDKVKEIRHFLQQGKLSHGQIAQKYHVTRSTISQIHEGVIWKES